MKHLTYKGHFLAINELPTFCGNSKLYRGMSVIDGKDWKVDAVTVNQIEEWFKCTIDNREQEIKYKQILNDWGNRQKVIKYKNKSLTITAQQRFKDGRMKVVYLGHFSYYKDPSRPFYSKEKTIESVHYDKVVSKFERFVDEYCTDWRKCDVWDSSKYTYKGYNLYFRKEYGVERYFGTCQIHKNSIFKCISNSIQEIENKFKARIDRVIQGKERKNMNPLSSIIVPRFEKEEKIKELEGVIARLQKELDEVKKEKEIYIYKGVILEYGKENISNEYLVGTIKNTLGDSKEFCQYSSKTIKEEFEKYIDELEKSANLYCQLTGKKIHE
jgi:hypothetical protein